MAFDLQKADNQEPTAGSLRLKILAKSFAKVNPRLKVLGQLEDGYHELDISFLSVNLADRITFQTSAGGDIALSTGADIPTRKNLCYRAARKLKEACSTERGATITLEKNIPIGGGLGGGSSNAATTLICLNRLWKCRLSRRDLIEIGGEFGADVPFFFYGGYCTGAGKGARLRKKENPFLDRLVPLLIPPFLQLTPEVYSRFDELTNSSGAPESEEEFTSGPGAGPFDVKNDLERAALDLNPELEPYLDLLRKASTIETAGVAGSGSSTFGISHENVSSGEIEAELEPGLRTISGEAKLIITRPTNHGQMVIEEG
jgi:4-diphosphocytidyl-2-C-methyl-D-erythritol kinase